MPKLNKYPLRVSPKLRANAEAGDAEAMNEMGRRYYYRKRTKRNLDQAFAWFNKAMEAGSTKGLFNVGMMIVVHKHLDADKIACGLKYIQRAAKQGLSFAQFFLGAMYLLGEFGVLKNDTMALKWFLKAAEQGLPKAQYHSAFMFYNARGVEKNIIEACTWFRKAAEQGYAPAQYSLGLLMINKKSLPEQNFDHLDGLIMLYEAAKNGYEPAKRYLVID